MDLTAISVKNQFCVDYYDKDFKIKWNEMKHDNVMVL